MTLEVITETRMVEQAFSLFRKAGLINAQTRNIVGGFLAHCKVVKVEEGAYVEEVKLRFIHKTERFSVFQSVKLVRNPDDTIQLLQGPQALEDEDPPDLKIMIDCVKEVNFSDYCRTRYTFKGERNGQSVIVDFFPYEGE